MWGPDELEAMKGGNDLAERRWGNKMLSGEFLIDKYTTVAKVPVRDLLEDEAEPDFWAVWRLPESIRRSVLPGTWVLTVPCSLLGFTSLIPKCRAPSSSGSGARRF